jgi:hypothetical protein
MNKFLQLELFKLPLELNEHTESKVLRERTGTFVDNMKLPVHRWFRYSAGFSAGWVEQVITDLKPQNILDPFAGSGTVCVTADKLGINSFGIEAHPFVYKLAMGKLSWNVSIDTFIQTFAELKNFAINIPFNFPEKVPVLLNKCYSHEILVDLFKIRQAYFELAPSLSENLRSLIFLAISAILRPSSYVGTAQWQYVLPNKRKSKVCLPFDALEKQINLMQEDMYYIQSFSQLNQSILIQGDARNLENIPDKSIDLVITSPPYANNYDYADATRLEMTFWGEINCWGDLHETVRKFLIRSSSQHASKDKLNLDDLLSQTMIEPIRQELMSVCRELQTIRETKSGNKAYHTMIAAYFNDLSCVLHTLRRVTKSNCEICFVIGDSAPYGVYVPVEQWLGQLAIAAGFHSWSFEKIRQRNIKWKNRKHNIPLHEGRLWIKG